MPAAFFGHGAPFNTLLSNEYTDAWRAYGATLPRPRAILVVSAHWYVPGLRITAQAMPPTVHDFNSRFPRPLFDFRYPAPGAPDLIARIEELCAPTPVERDTTWGIDHGSFSVLAHVFPAADVPVVQLSLDRRKTAREHYALARRLAPLRDEGVLIVGSGNVVHNLELGRFTQGSEPYPWASRFQSRIATCIADHEHVPIVDYGLAGDDARYSVPTPDHYLPLLYVVAQQRDADGVTMISDGIAHAAAGMLSFGIGA